MIPASEARGIATTASLPTGTFSIKKEYKTQLPFIGEAKVHLCLEPKFEDGRWTGVQCIHSELLPSPHLTGSHIESARHVYGNAKDVSDVLTFHPKTREAMHVQLEAEQIPIERIESRNGTVSFIFSSGDTYSLINDKQFTDFPTEYVITRKSLETALGNFNAKAVLICIKGHENTITNWPYLTNNAVLFLVECGVELVGLNIPSFDRETDGGHTSNHKLFFKDENRLIAESLALEKAPLGRVMLTLNPESYADQCADVVSCDPTLSELG